MMQRRRYIPRKTWARLVGLCLLGCTLAPSADAATPKELATARRLFAEAEKDEAAGRWAEALARLEQVAAIKETAGVRFHLAVCQSHLGRLREALDGLERARVLAREQKADDVLAMVDPKVEEVRRRMPVLHVRIPESVTGASVTINGTPVDSNALETILLDPGTHQLVITVDGESRVDRYVKLAEGETDTVELPMPKPPPAPERVSAPPKASGASSSATSSSGGVPTLAWVAFGTGAVLGVGGYLAYNRADGVAADSARVCASSVSCDSARVDVVRKWDATALGLWIGAAAAVGTGVTIVLTNKPTTSPDVALVVAPDAVTLRGVFQ